MAEPDELLTVAEIAAELKMNQHTIRSWTGKPRDIGRGMERRGAGARPA